MSRRPNLADTLFSDQALSRNGLLLAGLVGTVAVVLAGLTHPRLLWLLILFAPLLAVALVDLLQTEHTLRRNYPVSARFRWFFEWLRPFLRSYIVESDLDEIGRAHV